MVSNKQVIFSAIPETVPEDGKHMKIVETTIDLDAELPEGEFILKTLEISVDPYMCGRMRDANIKSNVPPFILNEPMSGDTMSVVVKSNHPDYKVGDLVYGRTGLGLFQEYVRVNAEYAKIAYVVRNDAKENGLAPSRYVGVLGMPGMAAYYSFYYVGKPKAGETVYISAASGAVGQVVGQLAKAAGCYVVGSAGTEAKVEYLKSIGFDDAFNYKNVDLVEALRKHCPNGIDVYFDSVGGKMLDASLAVANDFARFVACGNISQYNLKNPEPIYNIALINAKRIKFDGYVVMDHMEYEEEFLREVTALLLRGDIKYEETVANGIEKTPQALIDVLQGKNFGKQVVHVADL